MALVGIVLTGLAGCADPAQIRAAQLERDHVACDELGFEPGSDAYTLCLLIQDTNRRIDLANQRLRWIESDVRFLEFHRFPFHRRW